MATDAAHSTGTAYVNGGAHYVKLRIIDTGTYLVSNVGPIALRQRVNPARGGWNIRHQHENPQHIID